MGMNHAWIRRAGVGALLATAVTAALMVFFRLYRQWENQAIAAEGARPSDVGLLWAMYCFAGTMMLPSWWISSASGALFGFGGGALVAIVGNMIGASVAYVIGRRWARGWVLRRYGRHGLFRAADRVVHRQGFKLLAIARMSPVLPYCIANYAFGVSGMRFRKYLLASLVGLTPVTLGYVYAGTVVRSLISETGSTSASATTTRWLSIIAVTATIITTALIARITRKALAADSPTEPDAAPAG